MGPLLPGASADGHEQVVNRGFASDIPGVAQGTLCTPEVAACLTLQLQYIPVK